MDAVEENFETEGIEKNELEIGKEVIEIVEMEAEENKQQIEPKRKMAKEGKIRKPKYFQKKWKNRQEKEDKNDQNSNDNENNSANSENVIAKVRMDVCKKGKFQKQNFLISKKAEPAKEACLEILQEIGIKKLKGIYYGEILKKTLNGEKFMADHEQKEIL